MATPAAVVTKRTFSDSDRLLSQAGFFKGFFLVSIGLAVLALLQTSYTRHATSFESVKQFLNCNLLAVVVLSVSAFWNGAVAWPLCLHRSRWATQIHDGMVPLSTRLLFAVLYVGGLMLLLHGFWLFVCSLEQTAVFAQVDFRPMLGYPIVTAYSVSVMCIALVLWMGVEILSWG
jgi:hypothetical protein